jgi:hypothetical protein
LGGRRKTERTVTAQNSAARSLGIVNGACWVITPFQVVETWGIWRDFLERPGECSLLAMSGLILWTILAPITLLGLWSDLKNLRQRDRSVSSRRLAFTRAALCIGTIVATPWLYFMFA